MEQIIDDIHEAIEKIADEGEDDPRKSLGSLNKIKLFISFQSINITEYY